MLLREENRVEVATLLLKHFAGRHDYIAVQSGGAFEPEYAAITVERLADEHLSGKRCLGFYLLDVSNQVRCSCVDFDNKPDSPDPQWRHKAEQMYWLCASVGLSPLVELSQSGNAAHVWIFFPAPCDAWLPRAFWRAAAIKASVPIKEIYPRQDKLTAKGMGNLIRYPLWGKSTFVDIENDWAELDPVETLTLIRPTDGNDLRLIAFQNGMGDLSPDLAPQLAQIESGDTLPLRVAKLIEHSSSLLRKRWEGDSVGMADASRSAVAMSLCCEMIRAYVPTPEIYAALRSWLKIHVPDGKYNRDTWVNHTVAKAYDFILTRKESKSIDVCTFRDAAHAYLDQIENNTQIFIPSGISELDESIDGIAPGEMAIVAGRPGHGKTAIGLQWLSTASNLGVKCLFLSEEMGAREIGKRRVMSISSLPHAQAAIPRLRKEINEHHKNAADVYLIESCGTIDRAEEQIDSMCNLYDVGLVAVDYMQLLTSRAKDRYEVVTDVSRRLKQAAMRNNVAVLVMCQLNRAVESRDEHEAKSSDLRESGQIEQDADLIIFGQYPIRFDPSAAKDDYRLVISKRRNGPIRKNKIKTSFNPERQIIGFEDVSMDFLVG